MSDDNPVLRVANVLLSFLSFLVGNYQRVVINGCNCLIAKQAVTFLRGNSCTVMGHDHDTSCNCNRCDYGLLG